MKDFNVLLTGCSVFTHEISECLKKNDDGVRVKVVGVNSSVSQLPKNGVDYSYVVPMASDAMYADELIRICLLHNVDVVIPCLTCELEILAAQMSKFENNGIRISISTKESLEIANNKIKIYERFARVMPKQKVLACNADLHGFVAQTTLKGGVVCCKLCNKSGGQGFAIIDDIKANDINLLGRTGGKIYITTAQLEEMARKSQERIILQEYVEGYDYSVCLLLDHGKVLNKVGYIGYAINSGAIMQGMIMKHDEAYRIAEDVCSELYLDGNVCVDFIVNGDKATLLEINPRVNATIAFCAKAGMNLLYQRCKQLLGEKVKVSTPCYGLKMMKYYAADYFV